MPARQAKGMCLACSRHLDPWWALDDWSTCACTLSPLPFCFPYCTAQSRCKECGGSDICPHGRRQKVRAWPVHHTLTLLDDWLSESLAHALFPRCLSAFLIARDSLVAKNAADLACARTASKRYGLGLFTTPWPLMDPRWLAESLAHALFPCCLSAFLTAQHSLVAKNAADLACARTAGKRYGLGLFTTPWPLMDPRWLSHLRMHSFPVAFLLSLLHGTVSMQRMRRIWNLPARQAKGTGLACYFTTPWPLMLVSLAHSLLPCCLCCSAPNSLPSFHLSDQSSCIDCMPLSIALSKNLVCVMCLEVKTRASICRGCFNTIVAGQQAKPETLIVLGEHLPHIPVVHHSSAHVCML